MNPENNNFDGIYIYTDRVGWYINLSELNLVPCPAFLFMFIYSV